jgi:hypothetical protein
MSYRSTKKGTVNIKKGNEGIFDLFMGIPCQRNHIQEGQDCTLFMGNMVGRGAWGTWHNFTMTDAVVVRNSKDLIKFKLTDGTIKEYRKRSPHMFRCVMLKKQQKHEIDNAAEKWYD